MREEELKEICEQLDEVAQKALLLSVKYEKKQKGRTLDPKDDYFAKELEITQNEVDLSITSLQSKGLLEWNKSKEDWSEGISTFTDKQEFYLTENGYLVANHIREKRDTSATTCFIIMPITTPVSKVETYSNDPDHFNHVLECLFVPAIKKAGFVSIPPIAEGADVIHARIIKYLESADLVLCDISTMNPTRYHKASHPNHTILQLIIHSIYLTCMSF